MRLSILRSLFRALILCLLAQALITSALVAQASGGDTSPNSGLHRGGVDTLPRGGRFSLGFGAGLAGADGLDSPRLLLTVTPRIRLLERTHGRLSLALPFMVMAKSQPPARDQPRERILPVPIEDLEIGPSFILAPSLEWTFLPRCCLQPSVFIGGGVRHDRGRTSTTGFTEDLRLTVDEATEPVLTFGFALERPIARRWALRFETRALVTFYGDTDLRIFDGFRVGELEAGTVTSVFSTLGLRIVF